MSGLAATLPRSVLRTVLLAGGMLLLALAASASAGPVDLEPPLPPRAAPLPLTAGGSLALGRRQVLAAGVPFRVSGRAGRRARGRRVIVTVSRGGRRLIRRRARVDAAGRFRIRLVLRRPGRIRVRAALPGGAGRGERLGRRRLVLGDPALQHGRRGALVRWAQARLRALGYLRGRPTGRYDGATGLAVMAYRHAHGVRGHDLATYANLRVIRLLRRRARGFRARFPKHGRHVEADLSKRIVVLLRGRRVVSILHTSPGRRATPTVLGSFRFYAKDRGRNATGMVDSNYFLRGYAVHGYPFVPDFPDSHGCLRIPLAQARFVFDWIRNGDRIDVYR